jgi:hypothetical protein
MVLIMQYFLFYLIYYAEGIYLFIGLFVGRKDMCGRCLWTAKQNNKAKE